LQPGPEQTITLLLRFLECPINIEFKVLIINTY
jgi:hypothetical protein